MPVMPSQYLVHGCFQVIVRQPPRHTVQKAKRLAAGSLSTVRLFVVCKVLSPALHAASPACRTSAPLAQLLCGFSLDLSQASG